MNFLSHVHLFLLSGVLPALRHRMLGMSAGIEELGAVRWDLALCLLACWVFCYFSIWKGVRSSGKVRGKLCSRVTAAHRSCRVLKSLFHVCLIFLTGGVFHSHVSVRDAVDLAHPRTDLTWSCRRDLLLPLPKY